MVSFLVPSSIYSSPTRPPRTHTPLRLTPHDIRFPSVRAKAAFLGLKTTTMMLRMLLKSMTTLTIITDTIPSYVEPRINSRKLVDGDVSGR